MKQLLERLLLLCSCWLFAGISSSSAQCSVNAGADASICSGNTITLGATSAVASGAAPFSFIWSANSSTFSISENPTVSPVTTTTYSVVMTDSDGCIATDEVVITVNQTPVANGGPDLDPCLNSSAIALPSGGIWSGSSLVSASGVFTPSQVGTHNLTYTLTANGCSASDQVTILVRPKPVVNAGADQNVCPGSAVQLSASATSANGAVTIFTWSGGQVSNSLSQNPTATPAITTTYSVTAVDVEGCNGNDQVTVFLQPASANAGSDISVCNSPSPVTLTGASPANGVWSGTGVTSAGVFTSPGVGNYTLTYTVTNNFGCSASDTRVVTVTASQTVNSGSDYTFCVNAPAFTLQPVTAGGTWTGSSLVTPSGVFTPTSAGVYTLTYTVGSGACAGSDQSVITVNDRPSVDAGANASACSGNSITLNGTATGGTAPYTITWSPAATLSSSNSLATIATPASNTVYVLTVTDAQGCSSTDNVTVSVQSGPVVNAGPDITLCDLPIVAQLGNYSPAGGTWSGSGILPNGNFTPTSTGTFMVTYSVVGSNGCTSSDNRLITVVPAGVVDAGPDRMACVNDASFQLNPVTQGGIWGGSSLVSANGIFTPSSAGVFNLTYTVNGGICVVTDQVQVTVYNAPVVTVNAPSVCPGGMFLLNAAVSGGSGTYTSYAWTNAQGAVVSNTAQHSSSASTSASFNVQVQDASGCVANASASVSMLPVPSVDAGPNVSLCPSQGATTLVGASPAGGQWSGSGITQGGVFSPSTVGDFVVNYCVTNASGCQACDQRTVQVYSPQQVSAGVDRSVCLNDVAIQLSDGANASGVWSGSGITNATLGTFAPMVAGVGSFMITLTVGSGPCAVSDQINVVVKALPNVNAGNDQNVCLDADPVSLNTATPAGGVWSGANIVTNNLGQSHFTSTQAVGNYTLTYTFANPITGCSASDAIQLNVVSKPVALFITETITCENSNVPLTNSSTGASSYLWDFNGEYTSTSATPSFAFDDYGSKYIRLKVTNTFGCEDQHQENTEVIEAPEADFDVSTSSGCEPLVVEFENDSDGDMLTYQWEFTATAASNTENPAFTFTTNGTTTNYLVALTVSNVCGSDTRYKSIEVKPVPVANFTAQQIGTSCSPMDVNFVNASTGEPTSVQWFFGDGAQSSSFNPGIHTYITEGQSSQLQARLILSNACGADTLMHALTVLPNLVNADFTINGTTGCEPFSAVVTNTGSGGTSCFYYVNGSLALNAMSGSTVLPTEGDYIIKQVATDGCGSDSVQKVVHVLSSPIVHILSDADHVCENTGASFHALGNAGVWSWSFGDGTGTQGVDVNHTFEADAIYTVTLIGETENGCSSQDQVDIVVQPKPNIAFELSTNAECTPMHTCIVNNTTDADTYHWDFGFQDGSSNEVSPCHTYLNGTNDVIHKTLLLTASNNYGCSDQEVYQVDIKPRPSGYFELDAYSSCHYPVQTSPEIVDPLTNSFAWSINGTITNFEQTPAFNFEFPGEYSIQLYSENEYGCADSSSRTFMVYPPVEAAFSQNVQTGCLDLSVEFTNTSENAAAFQWFFGDGETSAQPSPTHVYTDQGVFDVRLIATSEDGCRDTLNAYNTVETYERPTVDFTFTPEKTSIYFPEVQFTAISPDATEYTWNFGDGTGALVANPMHSFPHASQWPVTLTAENIYGCKTTVTKFVIIDNEFFVFVPNAFSPNNDGLNDVFGPVLEGKEFIERYDFYVYNRWGVQMFHTQDPDMPWLGNTGGGDEYVQNDAYMYRIVIKFVDNAKEKVLEGSVTMTR